MTDVAMSRETVEAQLADVGKRLSQTSNSKGALFEVLKQASSLFIEIGQSPSANIVSAMKPSMDALVQQSLLKHKDKDIRVLVATCISEIMRIVAPEAPYTDEVLKDIFELIVATFQGLNETSSPYFTRRVSILETVAKVRSCVVMLDLECDELIHEMFQIFFSTASEDPPNVMIAMRTIMCLVLEESEDIPRPLLDVLFNNILKERRTVSPAAHQLAKAVFERCSQKLEPYVRQYLTYPEKSVPFIIPEGRLSEGREEYHEMIYELYKCAPQLLLHVLPKLTDELLTDKLDVRLRAVKLLGQLFSVPGQIVQDEFKQIFAEFVKRFTDKSVEVRLTVVECAKQCLLANPSGFEADEIISALSERLQDYDNEVRTHVVKAICDFAQSNPDAVSVDIMKRVAERLRDKEISVRRETLQRLTEFYRTLCLKKPEAAKEDFSWVPSKIIRCCFDKDCKEFRPQGIETVLSEELFPSEFPAEERVKYWISFFAAFDKNDVKALERVLLQKQRLQHEMQNYITLRQKLKDEDSLENQKKLQMCCKSMISSFVDPIKAEEQFQKLTQIKDNNVLKCLAGLLDPNTTLSQSQAIREDLLKRIGEKHPQYEFMKILGTKCSYILFGKEHLKALLGQIDQTRASGKEKMLEASMGLLVVFTSHFPSLLEGAEEDLLQLLKVDNELIKEGVVQILAKAGGSIRGQLAEESGSVDLMLEKLCMEGTRKQAKYAVQALTAINSDSGLKALSALYRKLVDLLETGAHLPTVLQSLGCIAQSAMSVFELREEELVNFLVRDLFRRDSIQPEDMNTDMQESSEATLLKVFGLKTLVKSFLPNKDAQQRQRVKGVLGILTKFLECGEISDDIRSSDADKAQLRLAAAKGGLRLAKKWDAQFSPQLFLSIVTIAKDSSAHVRQQFLGKVHQFLKERAIPHKYACSYALSISHDVLGEAKQYIADFVETSRREARLRQTSVSGPSDGPSITYRPEYVLFYLVHVLSQEAVFPSLNDGGPSAEIVEPFYRQLSFFIWALVNQEGDSRNDLSKKDEADNISLILNIFHSIKHAEDAVDVSKSESACILCDMGILITKDWAGSEVTHDSDIGSIPLPLSVYKPLEGGEEGAKKEDASHLPACLKEGDSLLQMKAAFSSHVNLVSTAAMKQGKRRADSGSSEEEEEKPSQKRNKFIEAMEGTEQDGDVLLKSSGAAERKQVQGRKKAIKERPGPAEVVVTLADSGIGTPELATPTSPKRKRGRSSKENGELSLPDAKRGRPDETISNLLSDKRKRGRPKVADIKDESLKDEVAHSDMTSAEIESKSEVTATDTVGRTEPVTAGPGMGDSLKSSDASVKKPTRISVKKLKTPQESMQESPHPGQQDDFSSEPGQGNKRGRRGRKVDDGLQVDTADKAEAEAIISPRGTPRRSAKKISISGLESPDSKADSEDAADEKLVGQRIRVWWPLDKKFYAGRIEAYDAIKKRHKVLYDDGDVEVLNLRKERWEPFDGDAESLQKDQPGSPSTPVASQQSPQGKKKATPITKSDIKKMVKGESPLSRVASSPKARKEAKSEVVSSPAKDSKTKSRNSYEAGDDSGHKDIAKGNVKSRRQSAAGKVEKKIPEQPSGKESKISSPKPDDAPEGYASPAPSEDSEDSDDVPLEAWKSSRRKVH